VRHLFAFWLKPVQFRSSLVRQSHASFGKTLTFVLGAGFLVAHGMSPGRLEPCEYVVFHPPRVVFPVAYTSPVAVSNVWGTSAKWLNIALSRLWAFPLTACPSTHPRNNHAKTRVINRTSKHLPHLFLHSYFIVPIPVPKSRR
jgi:hypothetical protein